MEPREYERSYALEDEHWWFRAKRALVLLLLRRYAAGASRGLDVGCGTGGMLAALACHGTTWVGVDAAPLALAFSRRRGQRRLAGASALHLPFAGESFDVCLCLDVLYHRDVTSDTAALAECHRVLRPGGVLVVTDSALAWLRSSHDDAVHGQRRYTRRELVERIRRAGFSPLWASYAYGLVFPLVVAARLGRRLTGPRASPGESPASAASDVFRLPRPLTRVLDGVQALERLLLRVVRLPVGSSVAVVARKPLEAEAGARP